VCKTRVNWVPEVYGTSQSPVKVATLEGVTLARRTSTSDTWADASGEPFIINGLPAGPHKVLIELVNANHQTLDKAVVTFVIP
jgi:hypothetical protein